MQVRAAEKATRRRQTRHLLHLHIQSFHSDAVGDELLAVEILLYPVCGHHGKKEDLAAASYFTEEFATIPEMACVPFIYVDFSLGELHFAEVNAVVPAIYQQVDLASIVFAMARPVKP